MMPVHGRRISLAWTGGANGHPDDLFFHTLTHNDLIADNSMDDNGGLF